MPIITLSNTTFSWKTDQAPTLNIASLEIEQGQHLFLKGPSGCGKSTLLSLITGINTATTGSLTVLNQELKSLSATKRDSFRADHIGYIFQQFNLLPYLSVIDNVTLPCRFSSVRQNRIQTSLEVEAKSLLDQLRLPESLINKPVIELSIGQQQRVAAARALIGQPEILIADEPTSALDHDNRQAFISLLLEQANQANSTLVFVSHDPTLESLFSYSKNLMDINRVAQS